MSLRPVLPIATATFIQLYWATNQLSENTDNSCLSDSWFCNYYTHIALDALVVSLLYVSVSVVPLLKHHPHVRFAIGDLCKKAFPPNSRNPNTGFRLFPPLIAPDFTQIPP